VSLNRDKQLLSQGFERISVQSVALPHTVWKLDFDVEFDRPLTLAEETILRVVDGGITDPPQIAGLMGLDEGVIVPGTIVNLLRSGSLGHADALGVTPLGRQRLTDLRTRASRSYTEVEVRHDPYANLFRWKFDATELKGQDVKGGGYHVLPSTHELTSLEVELRHEEIQDLLNKFGLPFSNDDGKGVQRDIVRLKAVHAYAAWRPAELEVWYHRERDDWQWRVLYQGGEDRTISECLREMQQEGVDIIKLDERPALTAASSPAVAQVQQLVESVAAAPLSVIIQTEQHREALRDAILAARRELLVVSPWVTTSAVDEEMLGWFGKALDRNKDLRIVVGYGIDKEAGKADWKSRDQRDAIRRLNILGQRHKGRLRTEEIGCTHEKIVICDQKFAIVTSFNWLSFNPRPGKGIRRETGTRVEDLAAVAELRRTLAQALRL
jgi:hypothetical protein